MTQFVLQLHDLRAILDDLLSHLTLYLVQFLLGLYRERSLTINIQQRAAQIGFVALIRQARGRALLVQLPLKALPGLLKGALQLAPLPGGFFALAFQAPPNALFARHILL